MSSGFRRLWIGRVRYVLTVVVLAMTVGMGAATVRISAAFAQEPAVTSPDSLRFIQLHTDAGPRPLRISEFDLIQQAAPGTGGWFAHATFDTGIVVNGLAREVREEAVSAAYFGVLGVGVREGRPFDSRDHLVGAERVVMLSGRLWRTLLGDVTFHDGYHIEIGVERARVIGVLRDEFRGMSPSWASTDIWTPLQQRLQDAKCEFGGADWPVRIGVRVETREEERALIGALSAFDSEYLRQTWVDAKVLRLDLLRYKDLNPSLPIDSRGLVTGRTATIGLLSMSGVVALMALTNVFGMGLVTAARRKKDVAIRVALGGNRASLLLSQLWETLWMFAGALLLGIVVADGVLLLVDATNPGQFFGGLGRSALEFRISAPWTPMALAIAVGLAAVGAIAASSAPMLATWQHHSNLGAIARGGLPALLWMQWFVVVPQVALTTALLFLTVGTARVVAMSELRSPGFALENTVLASYAVQVPPRCKASLGVIRRMQLESRRALEQHLAQSSALALSAMSSPSFLSPGTARYATIEEDGLRIAPGSAGNIRVTREFPSVVGLHVLDGRAFTHADERARPDAALITPDLARQLWPSSRAVGRQLGLVWDGKVTSWLTVVGVVSQLHNVQTGQLQPTIIQLAAPDAALGYVVARASLDPAEAVRSLVAAAEAQAMRIRVHQATTVSSAVAAARYQKRFLLTAFLVTSAVGLLLGALGLYGSLWYAAERRRWEFSVRASLGASPHKLALSLIADTASVGALALLIGLGLGWMVARTAEAVWPAMPNLSVINVIGAVVVVGLAMAGAALQPARAAGQANPADVLKNVE